MALRRLPRDFDRIYGYRPALVETYVDSLQHAGTCFRAANWTCVGQTAGRGRFAPPGQRVPVKTVYVYPCKDSQYLALNSGFFLTLPCR